MEVILAVRTVDRSRPLSLVGRLVLAALLPAVLVSCGNGSRPRIDSPQQVSESIELLATLYEQTWGDVADRRASDLLAYADTQANYKRCMENQGFSYTPRPFDDPYLGKQRNGPPGWFPEIVPASIEDAQRHGFGIGDREELRLEVAISRGRPPWEDPVRPGYTSLPPAKKQLYEAAAGRCQTSSSGEGQVPPLSEALWDALYSVVADVVRQPSVQELTKGYPACMTTAGFPVESWTTLFTQLTTAYGGLTSVPRAGDWRAIATTPEWVQLRERERQAAVADAQCRAEVFPLTMTLLRPKLEQFARDHAAGIELLATQWAEVRAKAAKIKPPL